MSQAAISMRQTKPRMGRPNSNAACGQTMAKPGSPTAGRNSQGICHQIFPLCLCSEGDAAKLKRSHVAKVKKQQEKPLCLREGVEHSTRCDSSALLHWALEALENKGKSAKIPAKSLWERGNSLRVCKGSVAGSEVHLLPSLPTPPL